MGMRALRFALLLELAITCFLGVLVGDYGKCNQHMAVCFMTLTSCIWYMCFIEAADPSGGGPSTYVYSVVRSVVIL